MSLLLQRLSGQSRFGRTDLPLAATVGFAGQGQSDQEADVARHEIPHGATTPVQYSLETGSGGQPFAAAVGQGREMPRFAKQSFNEMWKKNQVQK